MRHLLPLLAIALILPTSLTAQDRFVLRGRVIDTTTDFPVPSAIVRDFTTHRVAVADSLGRFVFENVKAGGHELEAARIGYITVQAEVEINTSDTLLIKLYPQPIVLAGIMAVVKKLEVRRERLPYQVRVLTAAQLHSAGGNMQDVLATRAFLHFTTCPPRQIALANPVGRGGGFTIQDVGYSCVYLRGQPVRVVLYVDEDPVPSDFLDIYYPEEFEEAEVFGGGITHAPIVRLYTRRFLERLARGQAALRPVIF